MQNFTINASSRLAEAQSLANTLRSPEINSLHLFMSMLDATDSIIWDILSNLQIDKFNLKWLIKKEIDKLPKIEWNYDLRLSYDLNDVILEAQKESKKNNDEYTSEEHLFLWLILKSSKALKDIFEVLNINYAGVLEIIKEFRKWEKITDENWESKLNALKKYWIDLVELAKSWKIDPVIGR